MRKKELSPIKTVTKLIVLISASHFLRSQSALVDIISGLICTLYNNYNSLDEEQPPPDFIPQNPTHGQQTSCSETNANIHYQIHS